eukprot:365396-Chlamydomonas_euryale.AAC.23
MAWHGRTVCLPRPSGCSHTNGAATAQPTSSQARKLLKKARHQTGNPSPPQLFRRFKLAQIAVVVVVIVVVVVVVVVVVAAAVVVAVVVVVAVLGKSMQPRWQCRHPHPCLQASSQ